MAISNPVMPPEFLAQQVPKYRSEALASKPFCVRSFKQDKYVRPLPNFGEAVTPAIAEKMQREQDSHNLCSRSRLEEQT